MNNNKKSKQEAILETAYNLFIHQGFSATSMDKIAESVPVSKATLYRYFRDKAALFAAVIHYQCESVLATFRQSFQLGKSVEETLLSIADLFLNVIYSAESLKFIRLLYTESQQYPDLVRYFYESGPQVVLDLLVGYLELMHRQGRLLVPDAVIAARLFLSMIKGDCLMECLLGIRAEVGEEERIRLAQQGLKLFLKGYAP